MSKNPLTVDTLILDADPVLWTYEYPLSQWVASNLERISEVTGLPPLELMGLEIKPGTFPIDVVAMTPTNEIVVIENQLGGGDHDHFGKLLTHAAGLEAHHAIWIAESFSDDHVYAMRRLNAGGTTLYALTFKNRSADSIEFQAVVSPKTAIEKHARLGTFAKAKYLRIATFWRMLREALGEGTKWHPDMVSDKCLRQAVAVPGTNVWIWIEPHDDTLAAGTQVSVWPGDIHRNHAQVYAVLDRSNLRQAMSGEYARVPEGATLTERERDWHEPISKIAYFIKRLSAELPQYYPERTA